MKIKWGGMVIGITFGGLLIIGVWVLLTGRLKGKDPLVYKEMLGELRAMSCSQKSVEKQLLSFKDKQQCRKEEGYLCCELKLAADEVLEHFEMLLNMDCRIQTYEFDSKDDFVAVSVCLNVKRH